MAKTAAQNRSYRTRRAANQGKPLGSTRVGAILTRREIARRIESQENTRRSAINRYLTDRARFAGTERSYLISRRGQLEVARGARRQAQLLRGLL